MIFSYDNTPIYYTDEASGPALVLLHGFLESSIMWKAIIPHFTATNRVIALDFPGHGHSKCISETHTMELLASIVSALLEDLGIEEAIVVGHSMGGYVAMALAELHPEQISKLVLLNSTPLSDSAERKENRERALRLIPNAKDAFVSMAISNLFSEISHIKFTKDISEVKKEALMFPVKGITAAIKGMKDRKDRTFILTNFNKPKYLIAGMYDPILPIKDCRKVAEKTKTTLYEVEGSHMSHIENTEEIVKILHLIENNCT